MNLLKLIQAARGELGLSSPNAVASATDRLTVQFLALINKVGNSIITDANWEGITKEHRFDTVSNSQTGNLADESAIITDIPSTTGIVADTFMVTGTNIPADTYVLSVDSGTQVTLSRPVTGTATAQAIVFTQTKYDLPRDYQRLVLRTQWDQTNHWELLGPRSAQEWQYLKSGIISTGPRVRFRIIEGKFQIWPPNIGVVSLGFEYISDAWVTADDSTAKTEFTMDDDVAVFADRTLIDGVKFEFYSIKGFETKKLEKDWLMQKQKEIAQDHTSETLSLNSPGARQFIGTGSVPDSGFGV